MKETIIRIEWEGPFSLKDIGYSENAISSNRKLDDANVDRGLYQVYGCHPVYGDNVLLYIGKTEKQTFARRILREGWEYNSDFKNIQLYVGRLFDDKQPSSCDEWDRLINVAEKLLIFAHSPARNSSNILNISRRKEVLKKFENIRVLNYDNCRSLIPEISGELWVKEFDKYNGVFSSDS